MTGDHGAVPVKIDKLDRLDGQEGMSRYRILPNLNIVKIGGLSIIEKGRDVLFPIIEEIAKAAKEHDVIITCGGGERHRHVFTVGVDLAMPTGVLATMGANAPFANALIVQALLAKHGGIRIPATHFEEVPVYLAAGSIPICSGMPTYNYWEHPPKEGELPVHDTDVGAYLLAETFGVKSVTLVKDVDGVYTADPKTHPDAERLAGVVTTDDLRKLETLPFDPPILDMLDRAKSVMELRIIDGRKPEQLSAALRGEDVGTIVRAS